VATPRSAATRTTGPELYPSRRHDPPAVGEAERNQRRAAQPIERRLAFHAAAADHVERKSLARHHPRFDPVRRSRERHLGVWPPRQEFARDCDARIKVPARSATRDHYA
jgi:hypothetical protein